MAYSCDAFTRDQLETKRDGAIFDGLTQTNEIARQSQIEIGRDS